MDNIKKYLKDKGFHPASPLDQLDVWAGWYKGKVESFHSYDIYNGQKYIKQERASMQMAKKVSEDWANLILNEKVRITTDNDLFQELLDDTFKHNSFLVRANQLIEITFALGTGAFVEYKNEKEKVIIDYIRAHMIVPLAWDNLGITECAFASEKIIEGEKCYYINIHTLNKSGNYVIMNKLINKKGEELKLPENVEEEYDTKSNVPRFQILKPNIVNNIDFDSPFGVSVFANSIDRLKKVDLIFDSGNNEFSLGRKRIMVPVSMAQVAMAEGQSKPIFDPKDVAFTALNTKSGSGLDTPIDLTSELRVESHNKGMQAALNYLSDGCGLGNDRYEYTKSGGVKTATEVISEKSALFQNLVKHELLIEDALIKLCAAIADILGITDSEVSINFDDSIIEDKTAKKQQALMEYNAGIIDEVEYFMQVYGISEEEAKQKWEEIKERKEEPIQDEELNLIEDGEDIEEIEEPEEVE